MSGLKLLILYFFGLAAAGPSCVDMNENPVDWFFIYKANDGFAFAYTDANDNSGGALKMTDKFLNDTKDALGSTLQQLYTAKTTTSYVAYNDEVPAIVSAHIRAKLNVTLAKVGSPTGGAHAKGILAADSSGGFWLVHSVPKFPDLTAASFAYDTSDIYAQSFLCLSLNHDDVQNAAYQLQFFHPDIYSSNLVVSHKYTNISDLIDGTRYEGANVLTVQAGSTTITSFAKSNSWGKDLYEDLVCPYFDQGFQWETWRRSPKEPSYCTPTYKYDSINVNSIAFPDSDTKWSYTQDHAKWGLSLDAKLPVVCIGGINRMSSQRARGGGTVCMKRPAFWNAMNAIVAGSDGCSSSQ